jgi:hypothetical protein
MTPKRYSNVSVGPLAMAGILALMVFVSLAVSSTTAADDEESGAAGSASAESGERSMVDDGVNELARDGGFGHL